MRHTPRLVSGIPDTDSHTLEEQYRSINHQQLHPHLVLYRRDLHATHMQMYLFADLQLDCIRLEAVLGENVLCTLVDVEHLPFSDGHHHNLTVVALESSSVVVRKHLGPEQLPAVRLFRPQVAPCPFFRPSDVPFPKGRSEQEATIVSEPATPTTHHNQVFAKSTCRKRADLMSGPHKRRDCNKARLK
ncbi:hypothetical protein K458DRAFT_391380 [Lentithecium fluviatile CBS 122367]|uniref:Uncharacterized protein n=1 Tax=Lentithecium fluviatile CBS 122367 TaxID=1168545 RepID=A0A6G1IUS7_9PLEO|nr:hypothetical protein K458DRAFT_391380 [Lentithecium fluviatile CBS 122367]